MRDYRLSVSTPGVFISLARTGVGIRSRDSIAVVHSGFFLSFSSSFFIEPFNDHAFWRMILVFDTIFASQRPLQDRVHVLKSKPYFCVIRFAWMLGSPKQHDQTYRCICFLHDKISFIYFISCRQSV